MLDVSRDEITDGSLLRSLFALAAPLIVQNLVQVVNQVVDTFWVGRISENALAAVGLNFPVFTLVVSFIGVAFVGTQVLVSQRVGADDLTGARRIAFHGLTLGLVLGTVVGVFVSVTSDSIIALLNPGDSVATLASRYLAIVMLSLPVMGLSDAIEGGFVGWGDSRAALYINVTAVAVNLLLDPVLIFGLGPFEAMGVTGAAYATVLGYSAGAFLALALLLRGRDGYKLTDRSVTFDLDEYRQILDIGLPSAGQNLARGAVRIIMITIVSTVGGAAAIAAYTLGARVASIAFIPASGLAGAAQSIIGQNLGADSPERASRTTWLGVAIAVTGLTVVGVAQWSIPETLTMLFVPDISADGLKFSIAYLQILAYGYWAIGATYLFNAGFNGARRTRTSMVGTMLQYWLVRLPIAAVGAFVLSAGVSAVFWAVTLSNIVAAVGMGGYYYYSTSDGMLERAAEVASSSAD